MLKRFRQRQSLKAVLPGSGGGGTGMDRHGMILSGALAGDKLPSAETQADFTPLPAGDWSSSEWFM